MVDNTFKTFIFNGLVNAYAPYTPKNIIAGDTDSTYLSLEDVFDEGANPDDVVKFADNIGTKVNESFPQFMRDVFNVPPDRDNIIQTDREVVSDKSYFLAKKMYVMHVINLEGKKVDKLKMMGVSIKKTDTPKVVQDLLKDIVEMLMNRRSYEDVRDHIEDFKERYHEMSLMDIGKPISVKSFSKYNVIYQKSKNMKGFPYHVRASIFYNNECSSSDMNIVSNDKVRIVYLKHPKYKYIALPVDADVLPEFAKRLVVDWEKQWETVMKKVNIFLTPIGYDMVSRQKTQIKKLITFKGTKK